jgi:hypothetical protein
MISDFNNVSRQRLQVAPQLETWEAGLGCFVLSDSSNGISKDMCVDGVNVIAADDTVTSTLPVLSSSEQPSASIIELEGRTPAPTTAVPSAVPSSAPSFIPSTVLYSTDRQTFRYFIEYAIEPTD